MLTLLLTCEHGGNKVPVPYHQLFQEQQDMLASHAGYDIGAKALFKDMQKLASASFIAETTRLLVELNRSLHHSNLFSATTKLLPPEEKKAILEQHYTPYRQEVEQTLEHFIGNGKQVIHVAVHTFTPVLNGTQRQTAIGLLFDPKRKLEQALCKKWKKLILVQDAGLRVRFNYPYRGAADGFPTFLRKKYSERQYLGIELEVNQCFALGEKKNWHHVRRTLTLALQQLIEEAPF